MLNTFDKNLGQENERLNLKHHMTNAGLMVLLLALLALPMTGFYAQHYSDNSVAGLAVPEYISGASNIPAEVLSSESFRSQEGSETLSPMEIERNRVADIERQLYKEVLGSSIERDLSVYESEDSVVFDKEYTLEGTTEISSDLETDINNSEEVAAEDIENSGENTEFDPAQYSPANIYPVYR